MPLENIENLQDALDMDVYNYEEDEHEFIKSSPVNPVTKYCTERTVKTDPLLEALRVKTMVDVEYSEMLSPPEVYQMGQNFIRLIGARKALDLGTYTGASAVAWALALPKDGRVLSVDVTHEHLDVCLPLLEKRTDVTKKINFKMAPALEVLGNFKSSMRKSLDSLIAAGETGTWDFAFIDADEENYSNYYERVVTLLRPRGVLLINSALWGDAALSPRTSSAAAIDAMNRLVEKDSRVDNALVNVGDGLHIVFKH